MVETKTSQIGCIEYTLEIEIKADRQRVWDAIIEETNAWWLPDFHMVGESSRVEFDVRPGGRGLIEHQDGGGFLVWYSVQFYQPDMFTIYLIGNIAPAWGGPSTSNLCLSLGERGTGCVLYVSDAQLGQIDDAFISSLKKGWNRLFGEGLRSHVESES